MEESVGAQYAVQIAVYTLKERCKSLQERIDELEDENRNLHVLLSRNDELSTSLTELDKLRQNVTELTEHNSQMNTKCRMVIKENEELWRKLTRLTRANKNLDSHLHKISSSIAQHVNIAPTGLIRSKTFTQTEPQTKILQKNLEENDKISLELEDISLKLADSISRHKLEMNDLQIVENCILNGNFSYNYDEGENEGVMEEIDAIAGEVKGIYDEIQHQKLILIEQIKFVERFKGRKVTTMERGTSIGEEMNKIVEESREKQANYSFKASDVENLEKICPMCSKRFYKETEFKVFQRHVEEHFLEENPVSFEMLWRDE